MKTNTHPFIASFLLLCFIFFHTNLLAKTRPQKIDPIRFSITTEASYLSVNEEFEIKITAKHLSIDPNFVYVFDGANSFKLKLVTPEGFKQTGGSYSDFVGAELTSSKPSITYTVKGKFTSDTQGGTFQLLRSHKSAGNQSEFVQVGTLAFTTISSKSDSVKSNGARLAVVAPEYIPYMSISNLKAGLADSAKVVFITDEGKPGIFRYNPTATSGNDDALTIVTTNSPSRTYERVFDGPINVKWYGAVGDGSTDNAAAITMALSKGGGIVMDEGIFAVSDLTFPENKVVSFINGGRLLVKSGATVKFYSKIVASPDDWIFDCVDTPTNYKNNNAPVITTAFPLTFCNPDTVKKNTTTPVHVKWFGATGVGYKPEMIKNYYTTNVVSSAEWRNDTKAIRFALTAIADASEIVASNTNANGGSNTLFFPKGTFLVDEELYVSAGTFIKGVGSSQEMGTSIIQMNPTKALFVLQSKGLGGLGGGGSAHNISELSLGTRPTAGSLPGQSTSSVIRFEDNKFNLDSRFSRIRFSNCPVGGSVFYVNDKKARFYGELGDSTRTGLKTRKGLAVTFHIYDSMIDVLTGDFIRVGENGTVGARIYNTQAYNVFRNLVNNPAKNTSNIQGDGSSFFEFSNCNFEGIGVAETGSTSFYLNDAKATLKLNNCELTSRTVDGNKLGAPIKIDRAKSVYINGGDYTYNESESNGGIYFMYLNGAVDNFTLTGVNTYKMAAEPGITTLNISSSFSSQNLNISNNRFYATSSTNNIIYSENPLTSSIGNITNNTFYPCLTGQPIIGNMNPGLILSGNTFLSAQDPKSTSLNNYGMKGRSVEYGTSTPSSGVHDIGDIVYNTSATSYVGWICTAGGTPGTWKAFGAIAP